MQFIGADRVFMLTVFRFLAHWPLPLLHGLGVLMGWLAWLASASYRQRWRYNADRAGLSGADRWASVGEAGKQMAELPRIWFGPPVRVGWEGAAHIEAALNHGQGILMLTPHMGCFETIAQAYAERFGAPGLPRSKPVTVLFRPPRKPWASRILAQARERPGLVTAPATLSGVRRLMLALKNGEAVGLLPDQVPPEGLGVWAPFFGEPAYTMTLSVRFASVPGTQVFLMWGERLAWGRGYIVHVHPWKELMGEPIAERAEDAAAQMNRAMEALIRLKPSQYLWGYARYKSPRKGG
jgi:Kdo2-lipid IVA lauroyltransferase/acyltransferase